LDLLIVDDDPFAREIIRGNLAERFPRTRFREADSGNSALSSINERIPDLVLLDLRMPGLNGFALIRLLRNRDRTRSLPVIAISGLRDSASVRKAAEAGATDYCAKPIDFELLGKKIERIVREVLKRDYLETRRRNTPRKEIVAPITAAMPICYPERDGVWVDSPLEIPQGEPLLFDGHSLFDALRLGIEDPLRWTRVEHCHDEDNGFRIKLLFEDVPDDYEDQIRLLNRSKERFRRYIGQKSSDLHVDFPCEVRNLSGEGLLLAGSLPWKTGAEATLNVGNLLRDLSLVAASPEIRAIVRWTKQEGPVHFAGMRFVDLDDDLQGQLMAWCLGLRTWEGH